MLNFFSTKSLHKFGAIPYLPQTTGLKIEHLRDEKGFADVAMTTSGLLGDHEMVALFCLLERDFLESDASVFLPVTKSAANDFFLGFSYNVKYSWLVCSSKLEKHH